jgi:frataxin-like iron-binding protein CyaY
MVMSKSKMIMVITGLILISALMFASIGIYRINKQYPNAQIVEHNLDEVIKGGNTSISVQSGELIDGAHLKELAPDFTEAIKNEDGSDLKSDQVRVLMVHLKLHNNTDEPQTMTLVQLIAESLIWANGIENEIYQMLNPGKGNLVNMQLNPNQEIEIVLPYMMYHFQFQPRDWEKIDERRFDLVLSQYPVKHIVRLDV